jgi:hypothetical protein
VEELTMTSAKVWGSKGTAKASPVKMKQLVLVYQATS